MKKKKDKEIEVDIDGDTLLKLRKAAKLANVDLNTVVNVILALDIVNRSKK